MPKDSCAVSMLRRKGACNRYVGVTGVEPSGASEPMSGLCEQVGIALCATLTRVKEPVEK